MADDAIRGVAVAGCCTYGGRIVGLNVAAMYVRTRELDGLSIAAYNRVRGMQRGLTIGIYNSAYVLNGVQIGLLNRARNNKAPFRFLPILNVHL